jgi:hypothetical protein
MFSEEESFKMKTKVGHTVLNINLSSIYDSETKNIYFESKNLKFC